MAERERRRLEVRIREVLGRRGEGEGLECGEGRGVVRVFEGVIEGVEELKIEEGEGEAWLGGEEQIAEARAGNSWVGEREVNVEATEAIMSENGEAEDSSSEQVNSPATENASKEGSGNGKKRRKNRRGNRGRKMSRGSKGKNKIEDVKPRVETPEPVEGKKNINPATPTAKPASQSNAGVEAAAPLLSHMAIDPLVKASKVGTVKEPTSDVWPLFKASPVYSPAGGGTGMNAKLASLQRPGQTTVLGAATGVWAGDEHLKA